MEKKREDKCIVFTMPRSQWISRQVKLAKEKALAAGWKAKRRP